MSIDRILWSLLKADGFQRSSELTISSALLLWKNP